jgi:hypothetical protein
MTTTLEAMIDELEQNDYVAVVLEERRMKAAEKFITAWVEAPATRPPTTLRVDMLRAAGYLASLNEYAARIHGVAGRLDTSLRSSISTRFVGIRDTPTANGRPEAEDTAKHRAQSEYRETVTNVAAIDAAKGIIERRIRSLEKIISITESALRSAASEARAGGLS